MAAKGQSFALKTNLLYGATATANFGVEIALCKKFTLDIAGNYNAWNVLDGQQWHHIMVQPELRLWLCDRFNRHFFGLHALGGQHDVYGLNLPSDLAPSLKDNNFRGVFAGGGLSYGYQWILGKRWLLEATLGVGYLYIRSDRYENPESDIKLNEKPVEGYYVRPTKLGLSIAFLIF